MSCNSQPKSNPRPKSLVLAISACLAACSGGGGGGNGGGGEPSGPPVNNSCTTPSVTGGVFRQTTDALGLCYDVQPNLEVTEMHVMGGGLAMSDVDKDGFLDLYVTHGMHEKGQLYLGDGEGFVAAPGNNGISLQSLDNAGYFVDLNSDGWDDFVSILYKSNFVKIFLNDQTGQFTDATASTGIFLQKPTYSLAAADYDLDGDVDLFFAHWGSWWEEFEPVTEYLWQNDGAGFFTDVSTIVEIIPSNPPLPSPNNDAPFEFSFTPIFADINSDGYPDVLLAGDHLSSQVLINNAGTAFIDQTPAAISDENGMGAAVADYDNDGDLDWFVSSIYHTERDQQYIGGQSGNRLYANDGNGGFSDVTQDAGVRAGAWGWGSCFADFDNDGNPDIFHTNGMQAIDSDDNDPEDPFFIFLHDPSRLFMSQGDGTFMQQAETLGINHDDQGRGVVCTDYNNDGWVDILVSTNGKSPTVYRSEFNNGNHYIQVDLDGPPGNLQGIGARVTVETVSGAQVQEVVLGSNYLSQTPRTLHFGLGVATEVTAITVKWPGLAGLETRIENVNSDQRISISSTP